MGTAQGNVHAHDHAHDHGHDHSHGPGGHSHAHAPANFDRAYGMRRFSILAAIANAGILLIAVGAITVEAFERLRHPAPIAGGWVSVVAAIGIVINLGTALAFMRGREHD